MPKYSDKEKRAIEFIRSCGKYGIYTNHFMISPLEADGWYDKDEKIADFDDLMIFAIAEGRSVDDLISMKADEKDALFQRYQAFVAQYPSDEKAENISPRLSM